MDAKGKSQAMWGVPNLTLLHEKPKTGAPIWDAIGSDETGLYVNCHAFGGVGCYVWASIIHTFATSTLNRSFFADYASVSVPFAYMFFELQAS